MRAGAKWGWSTQRNSTAPPDPLQVLPRLARSCTIRSIGEQNSLVGLINAWLIVERQLMYEDHPCFIKLLLRGSLLLFDIMQASYPMQLSAYLFCPIST